MSDKDRFTRLRAAFRNAVVWGVAWGALGFAVSTVLRLSDNIPLLNAIGDGLGMGIRIGVAGAIVGGAFSIFVSLAYRRKRLADISWVRFGIGGSVLAGVFVPVYLQTINLLSGQGLVAWNLISDDFVMAALFGGITAAGTMKFAQRGDTRDAVTVQELHDGLEPESLGAGEAASYSTEQRSRAAEHH